MHVTPLPCQEPRHQWNILQNRCHSNTRSAQLILLTTLQLYWFPSHCWPMKTIQRQQMTVTLYYTTGKPRCNATVSDVYFIRVLGLENNNTITSLLSQKSYNDIQAVKLAGDKMPLAKSHLFLSECIKAASSC